MPAMIRFRIERKSGWIDDLGMDPHCPAHRSAKRIEQALVALFNREFESISGPSHAARPDLQGICALRNIVSSAFCHRPTRLGPIKRDVHASMVQRIVPSSTLVEWREDRTNEGDDRQGVLAVLADGIDIPPTVSAGWYLRVEAWSSVRLRAACKPDKAAIGTPAPGCVAPPAQ